MPSLRNIARVTKTPAWLQTIWTAFPHTARAVAEFPGPLDQLLETIRREWAANFATPKPIVVMACTRRSSLPMRKILTRSAVLRLDRGARLCEPGSSRRTLLPLPRTGNRQQSLQQKSG